MPHPFLLRNLQMEEYLAGVEMKPVVELGDEEKVRRILAMLYVSGSILAMMQHRGELGLLKKCSIPFEVVLVVKDFGEEEMY
jgi:hypothetical protein